MVFCYQNCSDLLWEKNCSSDREKLLKFEAEGREFSNILRSLEQSIQTVKGQDNFRNRMRFLLFPEGFSDQNNPTGKVRKKYFCGKALKRLF